MKPSERLRQEYNDWKSGDVLIEAADLLDECERALGAVIDATDASPKLVDLSDDLSKAVIKCLSALARLRGEPPAQDKANDRELADSDESGTPYTEGKPHVGESSVTSVSSADR